MCIYIYIYTLGICAGASNGKSDDDNEVIMIMKMTTMLIIIIIIIIKTSSFRKYVSNIPGNLEVKELQKTVILGTAHILRKALM